MSKNYQYKTPRLASLFICLVFFTVGSVVSAAAVMYEPLSGNVNQFSRWFVFIIGLFFVLASLRPGNRREYLYFSADERGLHFPSNCQVDEETLWLHVPWKKVGKIQRETLYSRYKGLSVELDIEEADIAAFFKNEQRANKVLGLNNKRNGFFVIGYAKFLFSGFDNAIKTLNKMKSEYT
ncbi:MAG: hypothetical protein R3292_09715 [Alcanivorax sp.]|nr:hypothetical protein [Alcanivorax sp.]